jgi:biopolymer transport protein ExbD
MSHGGNAGSAAEPNLTPLLDLVLQMLMFFIMCVKVTDAVTNTGERLPWSETLKPLARDGTDPIVLSVKPFFMTEKRDDFAYLSEKERESLRRRFRDGEVCIFNPTEPSSKNTPKNLFVRRLIDMRQPLNEWANDERKRKNVDANGKVTTPLHIRADGGVKNGEIYELTQLCKDAGFANVKVRAILGTREKN